MHGEYVATAIALRDLNCTSIGTPLKRVLLQRKVFLAQDLGLPLGYSFNWYIHGPYSPDLTTVVYQIIPEGFESIKRSTYKKKYSDIIKKVNDMGLDVTSDSIDLKTVQWYDLIATVAYFSEHDDGIIKRIYQIKPQFSTKQIEATFQLYKKKKDGQK